MAAKIFRINYKSDFILTMQSDAGWATPFCIKFWTGAPSIAYFAGWDGTTYVHCALDGEDPTKLHVHFDDHHLPIGDLKFQIAYHFTVEDFPNNTEDEVINQAAVIIDQDGTQMQVMLDLNGETAPEIEFNLPAYANEAQRIANENQRIANEAQRIANEEQRIANEEQRISNEEQRIAAESIRIANEESRISEFAQLKHDAEIATADANAAATLANEKAALAAEKAALSQAAAELANAKATLAQQKADYAKAQGDYAKAQGDYAKDQGNIAEADHERAESDHTRAENDHTAVEVYVDSLGAFDISAYHATGGVLAKYVDLSAALDGGDNIPEAIRKGGMSVKFVQSSDNKYVQYRLMHPLDNASTAADDFTNTANWQGVDDEPTAGSDNLVKSGGVSEKLTELAGKLALGAVYDVSAENPTAGPNSDGKWETLSTLLSDANLNTLIPTALRKGGMSIKFIQSSDNKYVQYMYKLEYANTTAGNTAFINSDNWEKVTLEDEIGKANLELSLKLNKSFSSNLINLDTIEKGKYFYHDGSIGNNNNYCISDFIYVNDSNIIANGAQESFVSNFVVYDLNKRKLRTVTNSTQYTYQSGDYYVRICIKYNKILSNVHANYGTVLDTSYVPYTETKIFDDKFAVIDAQIKKKIDGRVSLNLFDKTKTTDGYYIDSSGNLQKNPNFCVSDFIPVISGETYSSTFWSNCVWFDASKNFLAAAPNGTAPLNAAFIRITVAINDKDSFMMNHGSTLLPYEPYGTQLTIANFPESLIEDIKSRMDIPIVDIDMNYLYHIREHLNNPFIKTQIKLLGDSITAGTGGTGYSPTGEQIGNSSSHANVLTATCWSNMLYHYIDTVYNKDTSVQLNDKRITVNLSGSSTLTKTQVRNTDKVLVYYYRYLNLNTTSNTTVISFRFYGTHFNIMYITEDQYAGIFAVYVDGEFVQNVDTYAETSGFDFANIDNLSNAYHDVEIKTTNTRNQSAIGNHIRIGNITIPKSAVVKPWGISGSQSNIFNLNTSYVSVDDDFVILQYGTNDRGTKFSKEGTISNLIQNGEFIKENFQAEPIFMCANPVTESYETESSDTKYYHMWDVHDAVAQVCAYFKIPMIDNYTAFQEYADNHNITTDALTDGALHPNDLGYKVMFYNIMKSLGLARLPHYLEWMGETT